MIGAKRFYNTFVTRVICSVVSFLLERNHAMFVLNDARTFGLMSQANVEVKAVI